MRKINAFCQKSTVFLILAYSSLCSSAELNCNAKEIQEMHTAIMSYIENDSKGASEGAKVKSERCLSPYASAVVHYSQPKYDDQIAYLRHDKESWTVLGLATGFDGDFMNSIPEPLQQ